MVAVPQDSGPRSFVMVDPSLVAEVGPAAALLYGRICWRAERDGGWRASHAVLAEETGLSVDMIKTATRVLRDRGWVVGERASTWDATTVWAPVSAGQPDSGDSPSSIGGDLPSSMGGEATSVDQGDSHLSSSETDVQDLPPISPPRADEQAELPLLTVVPTVDGPDYEAEFARFWELWPSGRKVGKPKAALAYRAARKRAPVEVIAAGLHAHLPVWSAKIAAGEGGFVPHPTTWLNRDGWDDPPPVVARPRARSNAFADPAMGGPDTATMERFQQMMTDGQPRALGSRG